MPYKVSLPQVQDDNPQVSELFKDLISIAGTQDGDLCNFTFETRIDGGARNNYIKKIQGYAAIGNDAGSYASLGGGIYINSSGTQEQFVVFNGAANSDIYKNVSGTWTAQTRSLTKDVEGYFVQYKGTLYYTNGTDAIQKYDGTTWSSLAVGSPYSGASTVAKYLLEYENMLILARTSTNKNRLWISEVGTPETATTTFDFPTEITGVSKLGSVIVVTTQYKTYTMIGASPSTMTRKEKLSTIGCVSNRSMAEVTLQSGAKELWFVASDNCVRAFNGESSRQLDYERCQNWFQNINKGYLYLCAATIYNGLYFLAVPYSSSTYNNKIYTIDTRFERWVRFDNFQAKFLSTFTESGAEFLWFGEASGDSSVWKYPSGFTTQMPSASTAITKTFITTNLDYGNPFLIKRFKKLYAQLKTVGDVTYSIQSNIDEYGYQGLQFGQNLSSTISLAADNPLYGSVIWGEFTWGGKNLVPSPENRGILAVKGKIIKYKFSDSQSTGVSELYYFQHFFIPKKVR